jgi:hypothetical protein
MGTAQGEAGLKVKGMMVWSTAKGDLELRAEGEEGHGRQRLDKEPRCLAASVPELSLRSRDGDALASNRAGAYQLAVQTPPPCPVLTLAAWPYLCPSHQTGSVACAQKQACDL